MTKLKKIMNTGAMLLSIGAVGMTAFATTQYSTPAEIVANLTGTTVQSVVEEKNETGKTYGAIADENGKLDEFKSLNLQTKKDSVAKQVSAGTITQKEAASIVAAIEANQATCDGTSSAQMGKEMGVNFGCNGARDNTNCGKNQGTGKGDGMCGQRNRGKEKFN